MVGGTRACTSWKDQIAAEFQKSCQPCHSGPTPASGYDLSSYLDTLKDKAGKVMVIAGDPGSPLLAAIDPARADTGHQPFSAAYPDALRWVVECDAAYFNSPIHERGILNPDDPQFHGNLVRAAGWDLSVCQGCHGEDYSGGKAGVSCRTCHTDGPTSCTTGCHRQPPATGAHLAHVVEGKLARKLDCTECHVKPLLYTDAGHLFDAEGKPLEGPARVTFGDLAKLSFDVVPRPGAPTWDHDTGKCDGVYCHGGAFADTSAANHTPAWSGGPDQGKCGTCHGLPPSDHAVSECPICHSKVVDANGQLIDLGRHLDGKISLGDESAKCNACHGGDSNAAPPRDLHGGGDPKSIAVGLHQEHLHASRLRGPVACGDCHVVPKQITDPGHIDHALPAEVFPKRPEFTGLAIADGANASFDRVSGKCSNVYCHGGGTSDLANDRSPTLHRTPSWTGDVTEIYCGACHGIPPQDAPGSKFQHTPAMGLGTCFKCHPSTIDDHGDLLITGPPGSAVSTHMNGVVDHAP